MSSDADFAAAENSDRYLTLVQRLPPIPVMVIAEVNPCMFTVISTPALIMAANEPVMPAISRHPDPEVAFVPVIRAIIIRPIAHTDGEIDRAGFLHERRTYRQHSSQEN